MTTLLCAVDHVNGTRGSFLTSFDTDSIEEARERAEFVLCGAIMDGGFQEEELCCITFPDLTLAGIKSQMPHFFEGAGL
jgi:hypothetical protein